MQRRKFLKKSTLSTAALLSAPMLSKGSQPSNELAAAATKQEGRKPLVIATWDVPDAAARAWDFLKAGKSSLDAVEAGVMVEEANENNQTVGKGGRPDRDGKVSLDACIMDKDGNCGSVVYLQHIVHAVSVARKVMQETPHVMLAGQGAEKFAFEKGFKKEELLTEKSRKEWEEWKKNSEYKPVINIENHDTIGMITMDDKGDLSGACTTSGMAYKIAGRIGDSPIIGAGLFVDNEIGAATATGLGEEVVKTVGSFLVVELMRQGKSPQEACEMAIQRIVSKQKGKADFQVGFIAMNKQGETGGYCIHPGFSYRIVSAMGNRKVESASYLT